MSKIKDLKSDEVIYCESKVEKISESLTRLIEIKEELFAGVEDDS